MVGFANLNNNEHGGYAHQFHITSQMDTPRKWRNEFNNQRVITMQVDGDELNAVLWGLAFYRIPICSCPTVIHTDHTFECIELMTPDQFAQLSAHTHRVDNNG